MKSRGTTNGFAPTKMAEPVEKSRGGLCDYDEVTTKTVQRSRKEFVSDAFDPEVTLTYTTITFNTPCMNLFPDCQHVAVKIDESNLRFFIEPTWKYDPDGLKFANVKNGRNVQRTCTTRGFCQMLFDLMKWNPKAKYRIWTIYQEFGDKKIMVFNLDEAQQVSRSGAGRGRQIQHR